MLWSCDGTYDESVYAFQNSKVFVSTSITIPGASSLGKSGGSGFMKNVYWPKKCGSQVNQMYF